jgi:transposase InsO family protein
MYAELIALHGAPRSIRLDNGPELTSLALTAWCAAHGIALRYIQPGKPSQNAFIECFNRPYRTEMSIVSTFPHPVSQNYPTCIARVSGHKSD